MDIGSIIPRTVENPNRRSSSYKKQSRFKGSLRQIRGELLRILQKKEGDIAELQRCSRLLIESDPVRIKKAAESLKAEGFVKETAGVYTIQ